MDEEIRTALQVLLEEKQRKCEYYKEMQDKITVEIARLKTGIEKGSK